MKISIIGAGNVGATCASEIANRDITDELVMLDIDDGMTRGKALDIWQTSPINHFDTRIIGASGSYEETAGSEIVVFASGIPQASGMSKEESIKLNATTFMDVAKKVVEYSPNALFVVVSNFHNVMTYAVSKCKKVDPARVIGVSGILDTARFKAFVAHELNISPKSIHAIFMGGHGDNLVALTRYVTVSGIPILEWMTQEKLDELIAKTRIASIELMQLMGTPALYAPGAAAAQMVEGIVKNQHRIFHTIAHLKGHYSLRDIHFGVPAILDRSGVKRVIELDLNPEEYKEVYKAAEAIKQNMKIVDSI
ncbi:MAG: malate dehydrogenase [Bacteroidales bacterium]|nr:malate dehydrogenase [Bacteroidales bacterium]MCF8458284.1 malate dehydrogenase [Bacteroidales bacterium]